ncbi:PEP-CTERM protein-sorting domain-containing protein [Duganella sp. CF402]|uniref:hypothetical protein n=1 Tax=unclassified Duganella TaxID=2636909 RepID=UPI0008AE51AD|nr:MULTISPECIES: hypothetical protein [unclassified Duganella]RZT06306.1 putative secreted protein with PEP-CTERM sorting signal [Duganella sp. BK701]SEM68263.1 PEP-CTERM protein-sorting domain-containing protein [Duganella sp. CF402]
MLGSSRIRAFVLGLMLAHHLPSTAADAITFYQEYISLDSRNPMSNLVTNSTHSTDFISEDLHYTDNYEKLSRVIVSNNVKPSVFAETAVFNLHGEVSAAASGAIFYGVAVHGDPNSYVPLSFIGEYAVSGHDLAFDSSSYPGQNTAAVQFSLNERGGDYKNTFFSLECTSFACSMVTYGGTRYMESAFTVTGTNGHFMGSLGIQTDITGYGFAIVNLVARASSYMPPPGSRFEAEASAYIDPYFFIDPGYLALHPGGSLELTAGMGNAVVAVPEPTAWMLLFAGLLMLAANGRLIKCRPA